MKTCSIAAMDFQAVRATIAAYPATRIIDANGDVFAIYDPDGDYEQRPRQGWATIVNSDFNDTTSDLERPGVFRLNIGLPKQRFQELADRQHAPGRGHDFAARKHDNWSRRRENRS